MANIQPAVTVTDSSLLVTLVAKASKKDKSFFFAICGFKQTDNASMMGQKLYRKLISQSPIVANVFFSVIESIHGKSTFPTGTIILENIFSSDQAVTAILAKLPKPKSTKEKNHA